MKMAEELSKHFSFEEVEDKIYKRWLDSGVTKAAPDARDKRYVVMMPLPNVTGALHMGHAMDNVMQDMLTRWHRMKDHNSLWMPGCDHAGIATQAVVEKRLYELEGKTRHDIGREALVERIWKWKDEYQARIIKQQQSMGCSCDWELHRFTMDDVCRRAVREAFFRLFSDGLIYRGNRLVNWDCHLQTAVSDDEIVRKITQSYFWHINYPVVDAKEGEPEFITVATTRPETMLGDTAVAIHPDPAGTMERLITEAKERLAGASKKDKPLIEEEITRLEARMESHLPKLLKLVEMAKDGRKIMLPLMQREIPLVLDEWAKPEKGSGCVKITPAHDPNDYEVWQRHTDEIGIINLLNDDGTYNENAGKYAGKDRMAIRDLVVEDLKAAELLVRIEDHELELGLSDRSKTPVEPYLSKQWFVNMGDQDGGILCGKGTDKEFKSPGLAQAAIDAVDPEFKTATGRNLTFYPDSERYAGTFVNWLSEKRDWCISRQLWWGHQIPIWHATVTREQLDKIMEVGKDSEEQVIWRWVAAEDGALTCPLEVEGDGPFSLLACLRTDAATEKYAAQLEELGLSQDPDVLDTWFSSALWPFSTLGWPDPETAEVGADRRKLGATEGNDNYLDYYYPGSCLVTARDIITLWVARMNIFGLYLLGDVPFTDCFIHATIQDGKGERMSKSKGNGIDPIDIISEYGADSLRYVICDMQTGSQDIKLPVQAISPFTGEPIELATAKHGRTIFTYIDPANGKEFDVLGTIPELPKARVTSDRFENGRAFCTKLWNANRFAFMNLGQYQHEAISYDKLEEEDKWVLSCLTGAIEEVNQHLKEYNPSAAISAAREFFWNELCDWYLEFIKPRFADEASARSAKAVLAIAIDQVLRLFHPFVPYITEELWSKLGEQAPVRGLEQALDGKELLALSSWPTVNDTWKNGTVESEFELLRDIVRAVRDLRSQYNAPPSKKIDATIKVSAESEAVLGKLSGLLKHMAGIESLAMGVDVERPALSAVAVVGDLEIYLVGAMDPEKEKAKLVKQKEKIQKELERSEKKVNNPGFTGKAPAAVVEKERQKVEEMRGQIELIDKSLAELG